MSIMDTTTHHHLIELVAPGASHAASLLFAQGGRFLLGVRPPLAERGRILLRLTGVGGWSEAGESFADTARREALEETGSAVRLFDIRKTLVVHSPDDVMPVDFHGEPGPVAVVYRRFGTTPFDPWSETFALVAPVAIFAGELIRPLRINAPLEHPLFMWVYPEQMIALADADEPLEFLLADGAELFGAFDGDPARALVRLTDSIQALLTALGARAFALLNDVARLTQPVSAR